MKVELVPMRERGWKNRAMEAKQRPAAPDGDKKSK